MAQRNAQDGISMIQTAEGALKESHSILQRMRELSVQAANDTNTADDRAEIQKEINQLTDEVNRIGNTTEFNTKKLLNGGAGLKTTFNVETVAGTDTDWISVTGGNSATQTGNVNITAASAASEATFTTATITDATVAARSIEINGTTINYTSGATVGDTATAIADAVNAVDNLGVTADAGSNTVTFNTDSVGSSSELNVVSADTLTGTAIDSTTYGSDASITESTIGTDYVASGNRIEVISGNYQGMTLQLNSEVMSDTSGENLADFDIESNGTVGMQIGANEGQSMSVSINDMRSEALGIHALDVSNATNANDAISTLDDAIAQVSAERSQFRTFS